MSAPSAPALPRQAVTTALVLVVGGLAVVFDSTIMSIALKTLANDLHAPVSTIQWVTTAYLLALGVAIPMVGWAQARFGGKRVWMFALTVFMLASIACSLAWSAESLIAFRVIQGLGGGLMMPLMATLAIQQVPKGASIGKLMATVSLPAALGPILGPVIGGIILNSLDWPWLFWVNVPFCVVGLLLAWRFIPKDEPQGRPVLDGVGLVLIAPGLVGLLYGLTNVSKDGGFSRTDVWLAVVAGVVFLVAFVVAELRRRKPTLVDIRLLGRRSVASSSAVLFLSGAFGTAILAVILEASTGGLTSIDALAHGFDAAFWWAIGFTVVAIGVCFALPAATKSVAAGRS